MIDSGLGKYDSAWAYSGRNPESEIQQTFKDYNITKVIFTHAHLDHIGGILSLKSDYRNKFTLYCHEDEKDYLLLPDNRYISPLMGAEIQAPFIDQTLHNNEQLNFGDFNFQIIHTPGHTEGSLCLYDEEKKILFSGDCVFPEGSFGRVDFPGSNSEKMIQSLEIVSSLEAESLYAGHMNPLLTGAKKSIHFSYLNAKSMLFVD